MFGDISYIEWWLSLAQEDVSYKERPVSKAHFILRTLYAKINALFPGECEVLETSFEERSLIIIFTGDEEEGLYE
jgi:hypothetical protein